MMECKRPLLASCLPILLTVTALISISAGCAKKAKPPAIETKCPAIIEWQVVPEAQITEFGCAMGTHEKEAALIFTVGIKNATEKPLRYRLNIFLEDMDKGAGSLVPVKGKPPVLEPGKVETVKVPFIKTAELSKKVMVMVKTIEE